MEHPAHIYQVTVCLILSLPTVAQAQQDVDCGELLARDDLDLDLAVQSGCELSAEQISRLMDNPVGELVMVPIQYDRMVVQEPIFGTDQAIDTLKLIPTFPIRLGNWNLVNRIVFSVPRIPVETDAFDQVEVQPGLVDVETSGSALIPEPFQGSTTGFGDLAYVGLLTPKDSISVGAGKLIWALGPTAIFPTATDDFLGQGKVQVGPAAAAAYLSKTWILGLFPQHWWSVGGDDERPNVSHTNIQYFIYRNFADAWSVGASPNISIDWTAAGDPAVNLPIGIGVNKTLFIGKLPARIGAEVSYYAIRADDGLAQQWGLRLSITPVVPAAFLR